MANQWIEFVKQYQVKTGLPYGEAMQEAKLHYKPMCGGNLKSSLKKAARTVKKGVKREGKKIGNVVSKRAGEHFKLKGAEAERYLKDKTRQYLEKGELVLSTQEKKLGKKIDDYADRGLNYLDKYAYDDEEMEGGRIRIGRVLKRASRIVKKTAEKEARSLASKAERKAGKYAKEALKTASQIAISNVGDKIGVPENLQDLAIRKTNRGIDKLNGKEISGGMVKYNKDGSRMRKYSGSHLARRQINTLKGGSFLQY